MAIDNLKKLFKEQLQDMHYAETHIADELKNMEDAASHQSLKAAFADHRQETLKQKKRLEDIFSKHLGGSATGEKCEAIVGILKEGRELLQKTEKDPDTKDAALICAAQKVEHYEIATYGTLVAWAHELGEKEIAKVLEESLNEEKGADAKLNGVAKSRVNQEAMTG